VAGDAMKWIFEKIMTFPWGCQIKDEATNRVIVSVVGASYSSRSKTRADYEAGKGLGNDLDRGIELITRQESEMRLMASAPRLKQALQDALAIANNDVLSADVTLAEVRAELQAALAELQAD
jgi:hypothetical protein